MVKHHELDHESLREIADLDLSLHKNLCDAGIYVDDDTDEIARLRDRILEAEDNSDEYLLDINPTLDCNFNCWYCYENHVKGSMMSPEAVSRVKSLVSDIVSRPSIKYLNLGFFGGEPLMGFNQVAKPLIEHAGRECERHGKDLHVHFTTNAGLLNGEIMDFLANYSCGMQITFDGGKARHDKVRFFKGGAGSYDRIFEGIKGLLERKIRVMLRVNYDTNNIDTVESLVDDVKAIPEDLRSHLTLDFQRVWQDRDSRSDATEAKAMEMRDVCRKDGLAVANNFMLRDVRQACYADKVNHALVNYDGHVFACTARDFTPDNAVGSLGEDGEIRYRTDTMTARRTAKLSKAICQECRIAPLCGGGCSQNAVEGLKQEGCHRGYSESAKDKIILNNFQYDVMGEYPG